MYTIPPLHQLLLPAVLAIAAPHTGQTPASSLNLALQLPGPNQNATILQNALTSTGYSCFPPIPEYPHVSPAECISAIHRLPEPIPGEHAIFSATAANRRFRLPEGSLYDQCRVTVDLIDRSQTEESSWKEIKMWTRYLFGKCVVAGVGGGNGGNMTIGSRDNIMLTVKNINAW